MSEIASRHLLSNGLTVVTREIPQVPIVSFWVWYRVGSRNEVPGITGISHWVEHMMFKGTPSIAKGEIFRLVASNGGVMNAFTWIDYTAYFETLPSSRLDLALSIESDRMSNALFLPEEVESERTVIISEREGSENSPNYLLGEEIGAAAFQAHPYGHSVIGWKTDLQTMTRDDLYGHYRTYYTPNNATVVVVGDFDTETLLRQVREKFEAIPAGQEAPRVRASEPPQRGERRVTVRRPAGAPSLEMAYHAPSVSSPDLFPMMVLDAILSGGKPMGMFGSRGTRMGRSSRMYRALVASGLASGAGTSMAMTRDPYLFGIDVTPSPEVSLEQVESAADQEVEKLKKEVVGREEFERALKQLRAQLVYGSESASDLGYWLGAMETIDRFETYQEMLGRFDRVTSEDVRRVAEEHLTESNRTVGWLVPTDGGAGAFDREMHGVARAFFYSGNPSRSYVPAEANLSTPMEDPRSEDETTEVAATSFGSQPPRAAGAGSIALPVVRKELDNGAVLLVSRRANSRQVTVHTSFLAGSIHDTPQTSGVARFVAPMLMRGTEVRSFQQLSEETDSRGMALNTDAGRLTAHVGLRCLSEDFDQGLQLLAEVLRRPSFPEDEVEKLRGQIITGLREQDTSARAVAERRFLEELYPAGHPYHLWPSGTQEAVGALRREDLERFYRAHYRPDALTIAVVGDVEPEEVVERIGRILGDWRAEGEAPRLEIPEVDLPARSVHQVEVPGKFQSELVMGLPALSRRDPDFYSLRLGNLILGQLGLSGRLGASIRNQQGLAYHVSSDLQASVGPSPWAIRAGINPANVDRAIEAAQREIEKWRNEPLTEAEIADGKSFLVGSMPIALETGEGIARTLMDIEFYKLGLDYLQRYPGLIEGITGEAIQAAVRKWIHPDHLIIVVAGPKR